MRFFFRLLVMLAIVGGGGWIVADGARAVRPFASTLVATGSEAVVLADESLDEVSGCAVSAKNPGVLWVHNDSGDDAVLYAVRLTDGATLGKVELKGIKATDFEDMALDSGRLVVGDIGDNSSSRKAVRIHSVSEPKVDLKSGDQEWKLKPKTTVLTYDSGPRDAEALLIDPSGAVIIIDKVDGTVWRPTKKGVLKSVAVLKAVSITGADRIPGSNDVLIRTYPFVFRYALPKGAPFDDVWTAKPSLVVAPLLPQAEAVCASPDGKNGYTLSESHGKPVQIVPIRW
jgi:hypothetical protein